MRYKNENIFFGDGNLRSKNTEKYRKLTFSLPAVTTCPFANDCKKRCFALKNQRFKGTLASRTANFEESKKDTFVQDVIETLDFYINKKICKDKQTIVRIHTSGDFYNKDYLNKWILITNHFKGNEKISFQAYTKSIQFFKDIDINNLNIHLVFSRWDDTKEEDLLLAQNKGLQVFYATSRDNISKMKKELNSDKYYFCPRSSDGSCMECYKKNKPLIITSYH